MDEMMAGHAVTKAGFWKRDNEYILHSIINNLPYGEDMPMGENNGRKERPK